MARSAQDKFNQYLEECRETRDAINELEKSSRDNHNGSYAYACGVFSMMLGDVISELPRKRREEIRSQLYRMAQKQKNEGLVKAIKEA